MAQHERDEDGEDDRKDGGEHPYEPADAGDGAKAHHVEDEQAQQASEREPEQDADGARDVDLSVDIARDLVIVIAEHHQGGEFAFAFADVDVGERVDDDEVQKRREHEHDDGDADHRRAADILEEAAIQNGEPRQDQRGGAGDGDDRHQKADEEAQYVAHRRFVFEGEPVPDEGDALQKDGLARFWRFGAQQVGRFAAGELDARDHGGDERRKEDDRKDDEVVRHHDLRRIGRERVVPFKVDKDDAREPEPCKICAHAADERADQGKQKVFGDDRRGRDRSSFDNGRGGLRWE